MALQPNDTSIDFDYDTFLRDHLVQVFNERDTDRHRAALTRLYLDDALFVDPEGKSVGHHAIAQRVEHILAQFPENSQFAPAGVGLGIAGVGSSAWRLGPANGPAAVTGVDVVQVQAGQIQAVYVLINPSPV
ncbi:MAG: hypothetical protein JWR17_2972 [Pseudomonas sp.]|jgi:hypothetical protein|uniref:nuclear transport factor 2 family protein n=1 Tax=Pseudomonas sp. TaxID=306 RepID=UPI00260DE8AD|nr:nuclear transport factor 2 family protein [Pseudomonas sp.]MDB6050226.1 hypothetical protein [Pseudomonas sp.]